MPRTPVESATFRAEGQQLGSHVTVPVPTRVGSVDCATQRLGHVWLHWCML